MIMEPKTPVIPKPIVSVSSRVLSTPPAAIVVASRPTASGVPVSFVTSGAAAAVSDDKIEKVIKDLRELVLEDPGAINAVEDLIRERRLIKKISA